MERLLQLVPEKQRRCFSLWERITSLNYQCVRKQGFLGMKRKVLVFTIWGALSCVAGTFGFVAAEIMCTDQAIAAEGISQSNTEETPTIEWFKEELRITPKYTEGHQDVLGLSWAHFLTMVLLVGFLVSGLVFLLVRYRRTQEILTRLLEEEEKSES